MTLNVNWSDVKCAGQKLTTGKPPIFFSLHFRFKTKRQYFQKSFEMNNMLFDESLTT